MYFELHFITDLGYVKTRIQPAKNISSHFAEVESSWVFLLKYLPCFNSYVVWIILNVNKSAFETMATYNLFEEVSDLQNDLSISWGTQNLIKVNFDRKLPEVFEGSPFHLITTIRKLAEVIAENLVNGVLQMEFNLKERHQREVVVEIKIIGIGTKDVSRSSSHNELEEIRHKVDSILKDQNIKFKKVDNRIVFDFFQNLITAPENINNDLFVFKGKRILIVDDNAINTVVFTSFLEDWGIQYTTACNGMDAVSLARSNNYDGILIDIHMPIMNGIEAIHEIRASNNSIPIIVLSGSNHKDEIDLAISVGANDFLKKPVSSENLFSTLSKYLINGKRTLIKPNGN